MINKLRSHFLFWPLVTLAFLGIPFLITLNSILYGDIPFWYDPARDLLAAKANLQNPALLGPPSGIPGFFYGPFWIWLLSVPLIFSQDPRFVVFLVQTVPYFTLFPYILYKMSPLFGRHLWLVLWTFFILSYKSYTLFLWNPHLAPLLFLLCIYVLVSLDFTTDKRVFSKLLLAGFLGGLGMNFHFSFGIGFLLGSLVYLVVSVFILKKNSDSLSQQLKSMLLRIFSFALGIGITFIPYLVFELRHGFSQTKTAFHTLTSPEAVVSVSGISDREIIDNAFASFVTLLHLPQEVGIALVVIMVFSIVYLLWKRKLVFTQAQLRLGLLLVTTVGSILAVYLTSKNPVWDYHFISFEVLVLLLLGLVLSLVPLLRKAAVIWALLLFVMTCVSYLSDTNSHLSTYNLAVKEQVVSTIHEDAGGNEYAFFAYEPAIYIYEYDYLFDWMYGREVSFDPGNMKEGRNIVYVVMPRNADTKARENFINFRASDTRYATIKRWKMPDGTIILKRQMEEEKS